MREDIDQSIWGIMQPLIFQKRWLSTRQDADRPGIQATLLTPLLNIFRIICLLCIGVYTIYAWNFFSPHLFSVIPPLSTTLTWAGILALLIFPYYFLKNFQYGVLNHNKITHPVFYALAIILGAGCIGVAGYLLCTVGNLLSGSLALVVATCVLVFTWFLSSMYLSDRPGMIFQPMIGIVSLFLLIDVGVELAKNMLLASGASGGIFFGHILAFCVVSYVSLGCLEYLLIKLLSASTRNEYSQRNDHLIGPWMASMSLRKCLYFMPMTNPDADIAKEVEENVLKLHDSLG